MTEEKTKTDKPDVVWERAQEVIRGRILALREKQAAEAKAKHSG